MSRTHRRHWYQVLLLIALLVSTACASATSRVTQTTATTTATMTPVPSPTLPPAVYSPVLLARGFGCPDDIALDQQGRVIFTDWKDGGVNRVEPNGQVTVLAQGLPEAEGVIALPDGTLLLTEQGQNNQHIDQIVQLAPGSTTPSVITTFANNTANPGMDSISIDPRTGDILAADSPNGKIYRVSRDGKHVTFIAGGFVRPTEALADNTGRIFVADEYGNAVSRINADGTMTVLTHVGAPDDLAFDLDGTLLVTVLDDNTVVRIDPNTGQKLGVLASNLFEPQGLAVDQRGNLYVSEENANIVVKLQRGGATASFPPPHLSGTYCR